MFDARTKQVVFVPTIGKNSSFTDPSYHLPAYYELWARWADKDNEFWQQAAQASREFFKKAAHPQTGLMPDYAGFDGTPTGGEHEDFRFDAFRTASNVAVDYAWFAADPWQVEQSNRQLEFFDSQGIDKYVNQYTLDGKPLSSDRSTGLIAMNAVAALAATTDKAPEFVQALWDARSHPASGAIMMGCCILWPCFTSAATFAFTLPRAPGELEMTRTSGESAMLAETPSLSPNPVYKDPTRLIEERVDDLISRMTLEEKISQMAYDAPAIERLGIPAYNWWNECLHGVARAGVATVFPQAIGLAATWDVALMGEVATAISDEARAKHHEFVRRGVRQIYTGLTFVVTEREHLSRSPLGPRAGDIWRGSIPHCSDGRGLRQGLAGR